MFSYIIFGVLFVVALWCAWHISVADWRRRIIPDPYLFPLIFIGFLVVTCVPWVCGPRDAAIGAAFGYLLSVIVGFVFDWVRRRRDPDAPSPIGMGDIKLMGVGGLWLGASGLAYALVLTCIAGGLWGMLRKQKFIPFAPFFIASGILTLIAMLFLI